MPRHGLSRHPLYPIWTGMKQRCYNKNRHEYPRYGGKGVRVCDEWMNDPVAFITWAVNHGYKKGLSIDRIDPSGNYEPSNCRFLTIGENARRADHKTHWELRRKKTECEKELLQEQEIELSEEEKIDLKKIAKLRKGKWYRVKGEKTRKWEKYFSQLDSCLHVAFPAVTIKLFSFVMRYDDFSNDIVETETPSTNYVEQFYRQHKEHIAYWSRLRKRN